MDLPPTFGMYRFEADIVEANYVSVPRHADFSLDVDAICACVRSTPSAKLLFVTNPNNPDGSLCSDAELLRLLELSVVVVLDEAYIDFSTQPSRASWVLEHDNLIVLRTFSKLAGLAGMRVGYGVFPAAVIQHLWKIKQPYTPNVGASLAAIGGLSDPDYLHQIVQLIVAERARLGELLSEVPGVRVYPSQTNFLLFRLDASQWQKSAKQVKAALEQRGILLRYFDKDGLRDCLRVSVGRPADTDRFIAALRDVRQ